MLNKRIRESIELLSKRPLSQTDINTATDILTLVVDDLKNEDIPSSGLSEEYNNLYNAHKNDNVVAKDLPYVNREFYKHTFVPNEDVLIGFYADNHKETYYRDEIIDVYKLFMYDNHKLVKVDYIHPGSQQMNFGKLAEGEHILSYEVQDIYGRKSFRDYFEIRVKEPTVKSEYIVSDNEIPTDSDSIEWLNQLILNLDEKYN